MRSVRCVTAPVNTEHQSPLTTIREEDIRPSSPVAGSPVLPGTSCDLCSDEEHAVQRHETVQRGSQPALIPEETRGERRATLQERRVRRVSLLSEIGQRMLQNSEEMRQENHEEFRTLNRHMETIAGGIAATQASIASLVELLRDRSAVRHIQPQQSSVATSTDAVPAADAEEELPAMLAEVPPVPCELEEPRQVVGKRRRKEKHIFDL
uniref:Uncharacterized protein n=1 Tax=Sphaerodactylus townsendi TaxID=933632 RepID=A0ACB8E7H1_9SAUR